jgi:hypothetical protein
VLVEAGRDAAARAAAEVLAAAEIPIERIRRGQGERVDVRPFVEAADLLDGLPDERLAGALEGRAAIRLVLLAPGSGGARPAEVLTPFLGDAVGDAAIVRLRWLLR